MSTTPMTGAYLNDCPFCRTHNAILGQFKSGVGIIHVCRDCQREFAAAYEAKTWTYSMPNVIRAKLDALIPL